MAMNDTLAMAMSKINNAEKANKEMVLIKPYSKIIKSVFDIANAEGYIGKYEIIKTPQGGTLKLYLLNRVNKCGAIKPRYSISLGDYDKFEKRYLPAKDFGIMLVSTTKGIMTHIDAKKNKLGGILLAYVY